MHRVLVRLLVPCLLVSSAQAQTTAQPASATTASTPSLEEALKSYRADMQSTRADLMAKNLTLTADQAAKFWPVFQNYQKEQNTIMDAQLKSIHKYVEGYNTLDDAGALAMFNAHLDRDAKMTALRKQWLAEFQKVLPTKMAVRAMEIDRRLSLVAQTEVAAELPLVH
jgi:Spy/CpxP family protein refolding chaperone